MKPVRRTQHTLMTLPSFCPPLFSWLEEIILFKEVLLLVHKQLLKVLKKSKNVRSPGYFYTG